MKWETTIGLEVHCRLLTTSKLFSAASACYGATPNIQACAIDLGMPGVLPVVNQEAIHMAICFGLAINADIAEQSVFARKNYFYPDLPKGYQISQYELPIVGKGQLTITLASSQTKTINITRAHLEEDAGKSVHDLYPDYTAIDLNRAGTPLIEIVSEPELTNAEEAVAYMKTLHRLVRYLNISDGNMQEGSFRCDVNLSVKPEGRTQLGTRTELKNINSFNFVEQAIHYETERQIECLETGGNIVQETRLYDPNRNETRPMRNKEDAHDYRYFPDPDLPPITIKAELINTIKKQLPELQNQKKQRFIEDYQLSEYDSTRLTEKKEIADYFEDCIQTANGEAKLAANWILGELIATLKKSNMALADTPISAQSLGEIICRIQDGTLSQNGAKQVFQTLWTNPAPINDIIQTQGLAQIADTTLLNQQIDQVINKHPEQTEQYRNSPPEKQQKMIGFFVGQMMKLTAGKADPKLVNTLLKEKLGTASKA